MKIIWCSSYSMLPFEKRQILVISSAIFVAERISLPQGFHDVFGVKIPTVRFGGIKLLGYVP